MLWTTSLPPTAALKSPPPSVASSIALSPAAVEIADRLALERKALKKLAAQIDWDAKTSSAAFWSPLKQRPAHALARIKARVDAALHERTIVVLANVAIPATWRDTLRRDVRYRTLAYQAKWLVTILAAAKAHASTASAFRRRSADDSGASPPRPPSAWASFHDDMVKSSSSGRHNHTTDPTLRWHALLARPSIDALPTSDSLPSPLYLAFELFLLDTQFDKTELGHRLRNVCCAAYIKSLPPPSMATLVRQLTDHLGSEHGPIPPSHATTLRCLVRQMLHVRLAAAYLPPSTAADMAAAAARFDRRKPEMHVQARQDLAEAGHHQEVALVRSKAALEAMPTFVPDAVLRGYMAAVHALHAEAGEALGVAPTSLSADVILPLLVAVLSQATLPHLHLQAMALEAAATADGGEAAYYVALLQAAMTAV
ncbi:Aste57867_23642 [Aphanomyces stellatus]|uniref:Aste57867_23642 protein n=1 Tax=Aphanomyces stellatus TaxID=120398 RepID=A0A485LP29_9STRA|nr:hypothetical protein As57867_023570 [Aphanomyces stellatus]VFU00287.1 Aste57867_23642 [Aphanomyces stellatus]